jgi:hypothetical protein
MAVYPTQGGVGSRQAGQTLDGSFSAVSDFCNQIVANINFAEFFEIYKICKPLHRSKVKIFRFSQTFRKLFAILTGFCEMLLKCSKDDHFRRDFHGILPEFHRISAILMKFMLQNCKFKFPENFEKKSRAFLDILAGRQPEKRTPSPSSPKISNKQLRQAS